MRLKDYLKEKKAIIEKALDKYLLPEEGIFKEIAKAMRYSVFSGGKRIRPILVLISNEVCGEKDEDALPCACAFEMIHTYSLIHDDLPAIDDDDMRRGRPSCHKVFGEAMAILAGDALLTLAFSVIAVDTKNKSIVPNLIDEISHAAGAMVVGQALDISQPGNSRTLENMHKMKTASLIKGALRCGGIIAGANSSEIEALSEFGENIGLAFQVQDDILDIEEGKDKKLQKLTYPSCYGIEKSKAIAEDLIRKAKKSLSIFQDRSNLLKELADFVISRTY